MVKRLVKAAKEEMQRQDVRRKIIVADAEVRNLIAWKCCVCTVIEPLFCTMSCLCCNRTIVLYDVVFVL